MTMKAQRSKGRKAASKEVANLDISTHIKLTFDQLNEQLKQAGYELVIRRPIPKELVIFDYGLIFTKGSKQAQIYIDEDLQLVIDHLLETNEQVIIKNNWLSPDTVAITVPIPDSDMISTVTYEATGDTESDDSTDQVSE